MQKIFIQCVLNKRKKIYGIVDRKIEKQNRKGPKTNKHLQKKKKKSRKKYASDDDNNQTVFVVDEKKKKK